MESRDHRAGGPSSRTCRIPAGNGRERVVPIRADLRHFYRGPAWKATRDRIMKRAKNRCEQCGKPNHRKVWVVSDYTQLYKRVQYWSPVKGDGQRWTLCLDGGACWWLRLQGTEWESARRIRVVCTVAHLNHVAGDDRDENLKCLCQWCHLNYDVSFHKQTRATRKDAARPIQWERATTL